MTVVLGTVHKKGYAYRLRNFNFQIADESL